MSLLSPLIAKHSHSLAQTQYNSLHIKVELAMHKQALKKGLMTTCTCSIVSCLFLNSSRPTATIFLYIHLSVFQSHYFSRFRLSHSMTSFPSSVLSLLRRCGLECWCCSLQCLRFHLIEPARHSWFLCFSLHPFSFALDRFRLHRLHLSQTLMHEEDDRLSLSRVACDVFANYWDGFATEESKEPKARIGTDMASLMQVKWERISTEVARANEGRRPLTLGSLPFTCRSPWLAVLTLYKYLLF